MARIRSPNYPQISLAEAVRRVEQIRGKEGRNAASRDVLAKLIGFSGLNGASMGVLSAISKYGLLEDAGNKELKVSDLADAILFPHEANEKNAALVQSANKPALFAEINEKWPDHPPSDENLTSYLMRRGFSQGALDNVIMCYRETMALVTPQGGGYDSASMQPLRKPSPMSSQPATPLGRGEPSKTNELAFTGTTSEPYRVSITPSGIEVSGRLTNPESADALIGAIQALKQFLKRSEQNDDEPSPEIN